MFAYVPARGGSKRIPRKNIKLLGGKPILGHVLDHLSQLDFLDAVYVSTEDPEIARVAAKHGAQSLLPRTPELSHDRVSFIDLIRHDLPRFSAAQGGDREVLFVLATAALVPPDLFRQAHARYLTERPQVLMSCEEFHNSPFLAMVENEESGFWTPIFPDKVLCFSQELPKTLIDAGLFYFFDLLELQAYPSLKLVPRLMPMIIPPHYAVDVDTPEDWQRLEEKFQHLPIVKNPG